MEKRAKTIFCDIDGTLWNHVGGVSEQATVKEYTLLPNTKDAINKWDQLGYKIILTTGRKESLRQKTEQELLRLGIVYDTLIMGLGGGVRILINDRKPNQHHNTAYAINTIRNKGIPYYDFTSKFITIKDDQPLFVDKPWGNEELLEYNDHYVVKKLFMKAGECCSIQYHELKRETIYVLGGKLRLYFGTDIENLEQREMIPGDNITITPYTIHRMEGIEDSTYLECSSPEIWDVVRLADKYQRENTKEEHYL